MRTAIIDLLDSLVPPSGYQSEKVFAARTELATMEAELAELRKVREPDDAPATFDLIAHLNTQRDWSTKTFGPGDRLHGILDHIRKELCEIELKPTDLSEWIDVVILACDGAWRAGHHPALIAEELRRKLARNMARKWPDWRTAPPDKAIEHVRAEAREPSPDIKRLLERIDEEIARTWTHDATGDAIRISALHARLREARAAIVALSERNSVQAREVERCQAKSAEAAVVLANAEVKDADLARLRAELEAMEIEINKLDLNEALNARWVANGCRTFREYRDEWVEKQGKSVGVFRKCAFPLGMVGNWIYRAEKAEKELAIALARIEAEKSAREPSLEEAIRIVNEASNASGKSISFVPDRPGTYGGNRLNDPREIAKLLHPTAP